MIQKLTLGEIHDTYQGHYIGVFDAGMVYDPGTGKNVDCVDVIVWESEEASVDDDGGNAVARYTIPNHGYVLTA